MKKYLYLVSCILLLAAPAWAASDTTGTNPGNFLKLGGGARPISLGGAFVGLADDINAVYWNPAGLTQNRALAFTSMYNNYLAGITYTNLAVTFSSPDVPFCSGIALDLMSAGAMEETSAGAPAGTGRTFTPTAFVATAPFAFQIIEPLSVGLSAKVMMDKISTGEAMGYGIDVGIIWKLTDNLTTGYSARNLVGALIETSTTLPTQNNTALASNYAAGLSYRLQPFLFALDYNLPSDNQGYLSIGTEYNMSDILYGRLGFSTRSEASAGGNMSAGVGLKFSIVKLDYAYTPYADLGASHRIAFSLILPEGKPQPPTAEVRSVPESKAVTPEVKSEVKPEVKSVEPPPPGIIPTSTSTSTTTPSVTQPVVTAAPAAVKAVKKKVPVKKKAAKKKSVKK